MNKFNNNKKLLIANWKMNGNLNLSINFAHKLAALAFLDKQYYQLIICPPFTLLNSLNEIFAKNYVKLGAQDCSKHNFETGAYTGDISAHMLKDVGCDYVIIGHSERRINHSDNNEIIKQKIMAAHNQNLIAILCVGENLLEFKNNLSKQVIKQQLLEAIPNTANEHNLIIAYEPIWAIGTGNSATPDLIQPIIAFIQEILLTKEFDGGLRFENPFKIVYGGSVKKDNTHNLLSIPGINGLLIGGASLILEEMEEIFNECKK